MAKGPTRTRALRNLFRRIPDDAQILNIMFDLTDQPDRVAAIVGSAILEDRLRTTILKYFRNDLGDEGEALLFDDISGPLATFDAKIRLAYAFGMLNADTKRDFDEIRRIRNGFAHSIIHHTFESDEIRNVCGGLWVLNHNEFLDYRLIPQFIGAKGLYVLAVGLYHWMLTIHYPKPQPHWPRT